MAVVKYCPDHPLFTLSSPATFIRISPWDFWSALQSESQEGVSEGEREGEREGGEEREGGGGRKEGRREG